MKEKLTQKVSAQKTIQKLNGMADVLAGMKKKTNSKKNLILNQVLFLYFYPQTLYKNHAFTIPNKAPIK